jgi:hypothetical protein
VSVTNDGATILKSVYVDNPAAKVLVDISKTQDDEVGAGWVGGVGGRCRCPLLLGTQVAGCSDAASAAGCPVSDW